MDAIIPTSSQSGGADRAGHPGAGSTAIGSDGIEVCWSFDPEDRRWDGFLQQVPLGQFQQSSLWAQYKATEGWQSLRCLLVRKGGLIGGFQLLWRRSRWGRTAYVSKGPVMLEETPETSEFAIRLIRQAVEELKITAVIVQPPDFSRHMSEALARNQFEANRIRSVISTTLLVHLNRGMAEVERGFNRNMRTQVRQARRRGVVVREGDEKDVGNFFAMMKLTCERQGVKPNPSSELELAALWRVFHDAGASRLTIARCSGQDVAGQLCLAFGDRITLWKNGWTGQYGESHPNRLIAWEGIEWACARGFKVWDWVALDPGIAATLLARRPLGERQKQSQHFFRLCFGGDPVLLPPSKIWIRHPILRFGCRLFGRFLKTRTFQRE
ncbi:MAG: GNAT family N-acetyltransferase [Verrucomicrobia bacterium]|nr:GNAT family N-acetyltransferase [Verrucomicrobiota bacterium]